MTGICKNEVMNDVGTGKANAYPKSCPICKFGPCQRGVTRVDGSSFGPQYYVDVVQPAEPKVENKYAVVVERAYTTDNTYGDWDRHEYKDFIEFASEDKLKEWIRDNLGKRSPETVLKVLRFQEMKARTEVVVTLN